MAEISARKRAEIDRKARELYESGRVTEDYANLTEEEALIVILPTVHYRETEARFVLAMARRELPNQDGDVRIIY